MSPHLGFTKFGSGTRPVIVLHDWYCDHTSWDSVIPYLSPDRFTYYFADLRGYGDSIKTPGEFTLEEAVSDVIGLADKLGLNKFSLIGHSMSTVIAQRLAQVAPQRLERMVLVTPVNPEGFKCDAAAVEYFTSLALADDVKRVAAHAPIWGPRLSESWTRFKMRRWRKTANPEAVAKYVELWGCADVSEGAKAVKTPMLIIAGIHDSVPFKPEALEETMMPFYPGATLIAFKESGHYPMQEQPPLLATEMERFLDQ